MSPRLTPGQPGGFRRWHPCCRRCLLKDCERWFLPPWPQARYCSPACREAAEHWRSWHAGQTYRATIQGKEHRREQARRHRERERQRSALAEPAAPTLPIEPALTAIEAQTTSDSIPIIPAGTQSVGQRPAKILPKSRDLPCSRPGCYVLFPPRPVIPSDVSAPAHAARHYGEFASGKPDSGADAGVASLVVTSVIVDHRQARSVMSPRIEHAVREEYVSLAPQNRGGSGRAGSAGPPFPCSELGAW